MTPQHLLVHRLRPARRCPVRAIKVLLIVLAAGAVAAAVATPATGAEQAASDTLSTPAGGAPGPLATPGVAPLTAHRHLDGMLRADRLSHASLGLAIGVGVGLSTREPAAGVGSVVALAVAKELLDDRFDRDDLAAGAAGAGIAWLIVAALTR